MVAVIFSPPVKLSAHRARARLMPIYQTRILLDYFVWFDPIVFAIRKVLSATREKVNSLDCRKLEPVSWVQWRPARENDRPRYHRNVRGGVWPLNLVSSVRNED